MVMKTPAMHSMAALALGLILGLSACSRTSLPPLPERALRETGVALAAQVRERLPSGGRVLVLVPTGPDGTRMEADEIPYRALRDALDSERYEIDVAGPDLRDPAVRAALPMVIHEGWTQEAFRAWIAPRQADVVVSLIGLPPKRDSRWPPVLGPDLYAEIQTGLP